MPRDTFFNLSREKQDRITDAAIKEFACKGYQKCSIQAIVNNAGISKGSIYQYFDNKKELFFYILDIAKQMKVMFLSELIQNNPHMPFFELVEAMFTAGIRLSIQNTELYHIYQDIQHGVPEEIRDEFYEKVNALGKQYYRKLISEAVDSREVRNDISTDLATFVVYTLMKKFGDFLLNETNITSEESAKKLLLEFIEILKNGIKA